MKKKHLTLLVFATIALAQDGLASCLAAGLGDELFKLTASDAAANDVFGSSVAISGNTAVIGAPYDNSGSAYLFDVTTGQQLRKLTTSDVDEDDFGASVAINDNKALVGAKGYGSESAYLFDVTTGNELFKLTAFDTALGDGFGNSVAISGNTAIIGAAFKQSNAAAGAVYLFDLTTGQELLKLTASDAADHDVFGYSVAISGNTAIVGAPNDGTRPGAAYLFDVSTGEELFKLTASGAAVGNSFGTSVAISGNKAIVAAPLGEFDGLASVFDVTTGQELIKLTDSDSDPALYDGFAWSVAISGNVALVGNIGDNDVCPDDPICYSGVAWLFDVTTGQRLMKLTASDAAASDRFGWSVALNDNTALVGASGSNSGTGSAYVFSVVPEPASLALLVFGLPFLIGRPSRRSGTSMAV